MARKLTLIAPLALVLGLGGPPGRGADDERTREEAVRHYRQGQRALSSERWDEAEEEFRLAIGLDPLFVAGHYGLGQTYMAMKRYSDAVRAYTAAEDAFHEQQAEDLTDRLAVERRLDNQIKALQDDVRTASRSVSGGNAERIQRAIDRNEEQIRTLESLKNRDVSRPLPTPHWLSLALGSAHFRNRNITKAEEAYRAAVEVKPDLGEAHQNLAVVYMITGRLDQAEKEVELAEEAGFRVPPGLKKDIEKRKASSPR